MVQIVWWMLGMGVVLLTGFAGPADAAGVGLPVHEPPVRVRVHEVAADVPWDMDRSLREARTIVDATGLASEWTRCRGGSADLLAATVCRQPTGPLLPVLRLVRAGGPAMPGDLVLGDSLIDQRTRTGVFGTVYLDRVEQLAAATHLPVETLLARAMAHEVGHLLAGSPRHSRGGLMRARWSRWMLLTEPADRWRFSPAEARALRVAVARQATTLLARAGPDAARPAGATN